MTEPDPMGNPPSETPPADEAATLRAELDQARADLAASRAAEAASVSTLRETTRAANPTIPAELIDGSSPAEIAASVTRAQGIVTAVLAANSNGHAPKVPVGGAPAPTIDLSTLPASERIRMGVAARRGN